MPRYFLQIFLSLCLAIAASYYWLPAAEPDSETIQRQRALPQTYLDQTRSWSYGEDGSLTEIVEAASVEHYPQRQESLLESPRYYSHDGNDQSWSVSSERGSYQNDTVLLLNGNVLLSNDQKGVDLHTQTMSIDRVAQVATSDVLVTVTQGENTMRADGMVADFKREQITMMPNVESTYVQPSP